MFEAIAKNLNVPYRTVGTYVMFENEMLDLLGRALLQRADKNGVKGVITSYSIHYTKLYEAFAIESFRSLCSQLGITNTSLRPYLSISACSA